MEPSSRTRTYGAILLVLVAALVLLVALVPGLRTVPAGPLRGTLTSAVSRSTGRVFTIGGGPTVRLALVPTLVAEDVTLANTPWGSRPVMVHAKRVEVAVRLLPLLLGRVTVERIALTAPDLLLETDRRGRANWIFSAASSGTQAETPAKGRSFLSRLGPREVRISGAAVTFRSGATGRETRLLVPTLSLAPGSAAGGELDLRAALQVNGTAVAITGAVGGGEALTGGRPFPFRVTATTAGATATFEGTIARLPLLEGVNANASLEVSDAFALGRLIGVHVTGLTRLHVATRIANADHGYSLADLHVETGRTSLSGSATYTPGDRRPRISAELAGPRIDLAELVGGEGPKGVVGKAPRPQVEKLFPSTPLPLEFLGAFDAVVGVQADALVLRSGVEARSLAARVTLEDGALSVSPFSMTLGGGRVAGHVRVDTAHPPLFTAGLSGKGVALDSLLSVLGLRLRSTGGATELAASLTARGASVHDLMADLSGEVRVVVGKGRLEAGALKLGGDALTQVLSAINPFRKGESSTELRCAVINVPIEGGIVRVDRRAGLETSTLDLMATGTANLGTELLDLELHSRATQGLGVGLGSFSGAVRLHGPMTNLSFGLNPVHAVESTATTVGAAAATGGLSVVALRILERMFGRSPCQTALRNGPKTPAPPAEPRGR